MRRRNREINIFNMSLLDILCGALGAFCFMMLAAIPYYGKSGKADASPQQQNPVSQGQGQYSDNPEELKKQLEDLQQRYDQSEKERQKLDVRFPVAYTIDWDCDPGSRTPAAAVDADVYVEDDIKAANGEMQPRFDPFIKQEAYWPGDVHIDAQGAGPNSEGHGDSWMIRDLPRGSVLRVFVKFVFPIDSLRECRVRGRLISTTAGEVTAGAVASFRPWLLLGTFMRGQDDKVVFSVPTAQSGAELEKRIDTVILAAAEKGDARSQYYLGACKLVNACLPGDPRSAPSWLEKAAKQEFAYAERALALAYLNGQGVKQDFAQAAMWARRAAERNDPLAQSELSFLLKDGNGIEKDLPAAFAMMEKAALAGWPRAQGALGGYYENGIGVARDPYKALEWYRRSAESGYPLAQYSLAKAFDGGIGTTADAVSAAAWMRKAADAGNADAQALLAQWYYDGHGVERDPAAGAQWAKKAADQGNAAAKKLLEGQRTDAQAVQEPSKEN